MIIFLCILGVLYIISNVLFVIVYSSSEQFRYVANEFSLKVFNIFMKKVGTFFDNRF